MRCHENEQVTLVMVKIKQGMPMHKCRAMTLMMVTCVIIPVGKSWQRKRKGRSMTLRSAPAATPGRPSGLVLLLHLQSRDKPLVLLLHYGNWKFSRNQSTEVVTSGLVDFIRESLHVGQAPLHVPRQ